MKLIWNISGNTPQGHSMRPVRQNHAGNGRNARNRQHNHRNGGQIRNRNAPRFQAQSAHRRNRNNQPRRNGHNQNSRRIRNNRDTQNLMNRIVRSNARRNGRK